MAVDTVSLRMAFIEIKTRLRMVKGLPGIFDHIEFPPAVIGMTRPAFRRIPHLAVDSAALVYLISNIFVACGT